MYKNGVPHFSLFNQNHIIIRVRIEGGSSKKFFRGETVPFLALKGGGDFSGRGSRVCTCHCAKSPKVHSYCGFSHSIGPKDFTK